MDVDCQWTLTVQPRQTIRITLYDFELDVKTDGLCHESVEILEMSPVSSSRVFRDCGSLGQQVVSVEASKALIKFTTGQYSLAQRGFILYFEGRLALILIERKNSNSNHSMRKAACV
jgi:CUB domain